ncbi:MAG: AAA family ATPase [Pseudanabaenaceae cyanobacterium]
MDSSFLVIDTEGYPHLTDIAIVNDRGEVIYNKQVGGHNKLSQILQEVAAIIENQVLVFHSANHDIEVLRQSFEFLRLPYPAHQTVCTWAQAKNLLPHLPDFSLEYLSKHLNLKVNGRHFRPQLAHTAKYDALFTYQLYKQLMSMIASNPFSSTRVDNPFQKHADLSTVYATEFQQLSNLLQAVRLDRNHQSRGVVVIGEAGSGKTHLMMRLAQTHIKTNRLLFIPQPNNHERIFYHIYCCTLESLFRKVLDSSYTQIEYLLANTFIRIVAASEQNKQTRVGQSILQELLHDPLSMYSKISRDTVQNTRTWQYIETKTLNWWSETYGAGGFGLSILRGIVKFCRYRDVQKREIVRRWLSGQVMLPEELTDVDLPNWEEELSQENFAIQALQVLGRLSILDEPLIFVFDQLEGLWLSHHQALLQSFGHGIKEFLTQVPHCLVILNLFPNRWQSFQQAFDPSVTERITDAVVLQRPDDEQMWAILQLRSQEVGINLEKLFTPTERAEILQQKSIRSVLKRASQYFQHKVYGWPLPPLEVVLPPGRNREPSSNETVETSIKLAEIEERLTNLENTIKEIQNRLPSVIDNGGASIEIQQFLKDLEQKLEASYDPHAIITEANDIGRLRTIAESFQPQSGFQISVLPVPRLKLPEHILLQWEKKEKEYAIGFIYGNVNDFTNRIKNWNQLLPEFPQTQFILIRDAREPQIRHTAKVGRAEITKLNQSNQGRFMVMDRQDRIRFDLCYELIVAVQNRDLEVPLEKAIDALLRYIPSYWLLQILAG